MSKIVENSSSSSGEKEVSPSPPPTYEISLDSARVYFENKVPGSVLVGGLTGFTTGFYIGESAALYTAAYAAGAGLGTTALLAGTYGMRQIRQKDDAFNFIVSGAFNGAWIVTGLAGKKRGVAGAVVGAAAGLLLKVGGDSLYDTGRTAWIKYRKHTLENSKPRMLDVRKPMFRPEDSQLRNQTIIPPSDSTNYVNSAAAIAAATRKENDDKAEANKKRGWW